MKCKILGVEYAVVSIQFDLDNTVYIQYLDDSIVGIPPFIRLISMTYKEFKERATFL
jgi:hypothetical protein